MIARRSKFLKADGPTAHLDGDCGVDGCNRPVWRQDLCASHFKRKQRNQPVAGPIGEGVMPGGLELGEVPSIQDLFLPVAMDYVDCDSEDDAEFAKAWQAVIRWAWRWARSKALVTPKEALELGQSFGWKSPQRSRRRDGGHVCVCGHCKQRMSRPTHRHHRAPNSAQLELPFAEFFHEPDWADERRA